MVENRLKEEIDQALSGSRERVLTVFQRTTERVYDTRDIDLIGAYERVVFALANNLGKKRVEAGDLEKLAGIIEGKRESSKEELKREEYFKMRGKGITYKQICEDYPDQNLRGYEIAYGLGKSKKTKKRK